MTTRAHDLEWGAFSDSPPWTVDPDRMSWRVGVGELRARVRAEVPALTTPRRVPPLGRLAVTGVRLVSALGRWALRERRRGGEASFGPLSFRLRRAFERLGPTYIKLGQIISSGEGVFPEYLVAEFKRCRDRVPPEPFSVVRRVVEEDLGAPLEEVFAVFERESIAAASIAQVHRAVLASGEEVVVKVQRPRVARLVRDDIEAMAWIAPHLVGRIKVTALANPPALVELFAETIMEELDFRIEADSMLDIARVIGLADDRAIIVPRPHPELVTRRVLVMERLEGFAFDDTAGVRAAGVDTHTMLRQGLISFLEGAILHGVFHGDLHGGNLFIRPDGKVALLDFGITGRLDDPSRAALVRLLVSAALNDVHNQLAALRDMGALPVDTDLEEVVRDLGLDRPLKDPTQMSAEEMVGELQRTMKALLGYGAKLPKPLMLLVKNMLFLDGAIALHAPDLDIFSEVITISDHFTQVHGERLAEEAGVAPSELRVDLDGIRTSLGLANVERMSYEDLKARRELIRERFRSRRAG